MKFEFTSYPGFDFLDSFAETFDIPQSDNILIIPEDLGRGSVRKIEFGSDFKLLFHSYTFNEEFILKRIAPEEKNDLVSIIFYNTALPNNFLSNDDRAFACTRLDHSAIEVASSDLSSEIRFPPNTEILFTVIWIRKSMLAELLDIQKPYPLVENITQKQSSFLYHENVWPDIDIKINHLKQINEQDPLSKLNIKNKVQELIYLLFRKLLKREVRPQQGISNTDVKKIHSVRAAILQDLSDPPKLEDLAKGVGMSKTKMSSLFKQVFGDSIYNYYLEIRMEEAAFLLRESGHSVSEVGYQLGFSNLSHFSRLFKRHYDLTPKKYSSVR